jgi:2-methylcitrate dehydratase PrpD
MDAMLEIVEDNNLSLEDVKEIRLKAGPNILEPLRYSNPVNELQAKFSLHFGLSSILLNHRAGLREYTDEYVNSKIVQDTMKMVKTIHSPDIAAMGTDKMRSIVEVELKNGKVINKLAEDARGTPEKPLTEKDVYGKFIECTSFHYDQEKSDTIFDNLKKIEKMDDIRDLTALLTL